MHYEPGTYLARLKSAVLSEYKNKEGEEREKIVLVFAITHSIGNDGEWEDLPQHQIANRTVDLILTEKTFPYVKAKLAKMGFNGDFGPMSEAELGLDDLDKCFQTDENADKNCVFVQLIMKPQKYKAKDGTEKEGEQWDIWTEGSDSSNASPAGSSKASKWNAMMNRDKETKKPPAGRPGKPPAGPKRTPPTATDDDIPM